MSALFDLTGKVALVSGASRGIGLALARGLHEHGATVVLNGRDADALRAAAAPMGARTAAFDVTDAAAVKAGVSQVERTVGPIDILINNAGITRRAALINLAESDWDEVLKTNLTAVFRLARTVAPGMIARGAGKIISVASLMSAVARPGVGAYAAAKGGVAALTRAMCVEWAPHGLQVNALAPGYFATDLNAALIADEAFDGWIKGRTPAGRWGRVDELVGAAVFLSAPASSFVNGQVLYVDGGVLAGL